MMKIDAKTIFLIVACVFVFCGMGGIFYSYSIAGKYFARDVVFVTPRINDSRFYLNLSEVVIWELSFAGIIATESHENVRISSSANEVFANVIYTNDAYFFMRSMNLTEGNHLQTESSIIINEALAWRLFGTAQNITGLVVHINDAKYVINGVAQVGTDCTAWLPREASPNNLVSALYFLPTSNPLIESHVQSMLMQAHADSDDYIVLDINRFTESFGVRLKILILLAYVCALVLLARRRTLFSIIGAVFCLYVLFSGVNEILIWLPNLSASSRSLIEIIGMTGVFSDNMARFRQLNSIANITFIIGTIGLAGLFLYTYHNLPEQERSE